MVYAFDRQAPSNFSPAAENTPGRTDQLASRCFEGALAAMVAPLVGWLADHAFGLK